MTSYINAFTGDVVQPQDVSYTAISLTASNSPIQLVWPINGNVTTSNTCARIIDVTTTAASLILDLPPASQASVGQDVLLRNISGYTFTVKDYGGNVICTLDVGASKYLYLTNNSTEAGTWSVIAFGVGSSSVDAGQLAGYGLKAIGATLNQSYPVNTIFGGTTLDSTNRSQFVVYSGGVGTINLPASTTVGNNWFAMIRNNGTGILTIQPSGTDTIDGNALQQLQLTESLVIVSNGVDGYNTFGYGQAIQFYFTILSKVITGGTVTLTAAEASNIIQEFSGVLTSNCIVILPSTVQLYSIQNSCTGAYSVTFKTSAVGATTYVVPANNTALLICDGTNVYSANTSTVTSITSASLTAGSITSPSLNFSANTSTGLYLPGVGQLGLTVNGSGGLILTTSGVTILNALTVGGNVISSGTGTFTGGISGGTF